MSNRKLESHYQLDMDIIFSLCRFLETDTSVRPHLKFWPNTSLYSFDKQLRYIETKLNNKHIDFFVSQLAYSSAVSGVVQQAEQGTTIEELVCQLVRKKYARNDAQHFIHQLIDDQVLISELYPSITGPSQLRSWINLLMTMPDTTRLCQMLINIDNHLKPSTEVSSPEDAVRSILKDCFALTLSDRPVIHCTSAFINAGTQISPVVFDRLRHCFSELIPLASAFKQPLPSTLSHFKRAFYDRYAEREIPLATALDNSLGIGYGADQSIADLSLLEDLPLEVSQADPSEIPVPTQRWLLNLYMRWQELSDRTSTLHLTPEDIRHMQTDIETEKSSYHAFGYLLGSSPTAIDKNNYQFVLNGLGGSSPFNLLGRFCQQDNQITKQIKSHFSALQQNDEYHLYAEIAHCPSIQAGNVVQRPHLREYEIPLLTHSLLPRDKQILLKDLWVSVPGGQRVVLRSRQFGKEVLPRLTTAHNYRSGLPIYQFLCDLQQQNVTPSFSWRWGWLDQVRHLPRVQYKQVILKEARWRLGVVDINQATSITQNITSWRLRWHIPRFVALEQGDQELFLDLDQIDCQELLFDSLRRLTSICVVEWLRTPEQCCFTGPEGRLTHEIVIPFIGNNFKTTKISPLSVSSQAERTFLPGSQWFYLKIYANPAFSSVIINKLGRLARSFLRDNLISHWFFIHYTDPNHHLRFRCHLHDPSDMYLVLKACQHALATLLRNESISKLQLDTYDREIERYGQSRMEETEQLFWIDSDTVYQLHQQPDRDAEPLAAALLGVHTYLTDFGMSLPDRLMFCQQIFDHLFKENGTSATLKKTLAAKYRLNTSLVHRLIEQNNMTVAECGYQHLFQKRSQKIRVYLDTITKEHFSTQYVASIIHLFLNRLFEKHQRTYELIIYHHLMRTYQSLLSRVIKD